MTPTLVAAVVILVAASIGGVMGLMVRKVILARSGEQPKAPALATISALLGLTAAIFTGWALSGGDVLVGVCGAIVAIALLTAAKHVRGREHRL